MEKRPFSRKTFKMELGVLITAHAFNACAPFNGVDGKSGTSISNASFRSLIIFPIYLFCRCFSYRQHPINTFHSIWMNALRSLSLLFAFLLLAQCLCVAWQPIPISIIISRRKGGCKLKNRKGRKTRCGWGGWQERERAKGASVWFRCVHDTKSPRIWTGYQNNRYNIMWYTVTLPQYICVC